METKKVRKQNVIPIKEAKKIRINLFMVYFISLMYLELTFRLIIFEIADFFSLEFLYACSFNLILASIFSFFSLLFHHKVNRRISLTILYLMGVWFSLQFFFKRVFNTFFSIYLFGIADQAIEFSGTAILEIFKNLPLIILLFLPYILTLIYKKDINFHHLKNMKIYIIDIIIILISFLSFKMFLNINKDAENSAYSLFYEVENNAINFNKLG